MIMASDAEIMRAAIAKAGSQSRVAQQLGISKSMVGRVARGERSGARYRAAAQDITSGRQVTPPPPTSRTPKRVRQPVRRPRPGGGQRVSMRGRGARGALFQREASRAPSIDHLGGIVLTATVARESGYARRGGSTWHGSLEITPEQFDRVRGGFATWGDVLHESRPWVDPNDVEVDGLEWDYLY